MVCPSPGAHARATSLHTVLQNHASSHSSHLNRYKKGSQICIYRCQRRHQDRALTSPCQKCAGKNVRIPCEYCADQCIHTQIFRLVHEKIEVRTRTPTFFFAMPLRETHTSKYTHTPAQDACACSTHARKQIRTRKRTYTDASPGENARTYARTHACTQLQVNIGHTVDMHVHTHAHICVRTQ